MLFLWNGKAYRELEYKNNELKSLYDMALKNIKYLEADLRKAEDRIKSRDDIISSLKKQILLLTGEIADIKQYYVPPEVVSAAKQVFNRQMQIVCQVASIDATQKNEVTKLDAILDILSKDVD